MNIPRKIFIFNFFICALLAGMSFKYNTIDGIPLCPLCFIQVLIFYVIAVVSLIFFVMLPKNNGRVGYSIFIVISTLIGIIAASRQIWMNNSSHSKVFPCSPDTMTYLLKLRFHDFFHSFVPVYSNCVLLDWQFLGLTMPMWSLIFLSMLLVVGVVMYFHRHDFSQELSRC